MILSKKKTRSALAEFCAIAKAIKAASLQAPTSEAWLFHQKNSLSEVADIAVVDGKATGSSDVGGKVAL